MKYFLFEKYTVTTRLSIAEAQRRVESNIDQGRNWPFLVRTATQPYIGTVDSETFTIRRVLTWHNPWQPIITGHFKPTSVSIHLQPHIMPLLFMTIWTFVLASVFIGFLNSAAHMIAIIPLLLLIATHIFIWRTFTRESAIARKFLTTLFQEQ